jgi:hypothetical protein
MVYKGGMVEVVETPEAKLKRHEDALVACMAEITKLREENARLRSSESNAHSVLREVYNDPTASPAVRVKAAGLALPHETPRLTPVPPAIDATCEEIEPLSVVVERQRKRADAIMALPLAERERMITGVVKRDGNGQDGDTGS